MESMSNVLNLMLDAEDDVLDEEIQDLDDNNDASSEPAGTCNPQGGVYEDLDLEEIDGSDEMMLDAPDIEERKSKPKLADSNKPKLASRQQERIMQFESRKPVRQGRGRIIGGGSTSGGAIGGR